MLSTDDLCCGMRAPKGESRESQKGIIFFISFFIADQYTSGIGIHLLSTNLVKIFNTACINNALLSYNYHKEAK